MEGAAQHGGFFEVAAFGAQILHRSQSGLHDFGGLFGEDLQHLIVDFGLVHRRRWYGTGRRGSSNCRMGGRSRRRRGCGAT